MFLCYIFENKCFKFLSMNFFLNIPNVSLNFDLNKIGYAINSLNLYISSSANVSQT